MLFIWNHSESQFRHTPHSHASHMMPGKTIAIGDAIEIYWPDDNEHYAGSVVAFDPGTSKHLIHYEDGEVEELDLAGEQWHFQKNASKQAIRNSMQTSHLPNTLVQQPCVSSPVSITVPAHSAVSSFYKLSTQPQRIKNRRKSSNLPTRTSKRLREKSSRSSSESKITSMLSLVDGNDTALQLIESCMNHWLLYGGHQKGSRFSTIQCLTHMYDLLTCAAVDSTIYSKLLSSKIYNPTWTLKELVLHSSTLDSGYQESRSNGEWTSQKLMLSKISLVVLESVSNSQRSEGSPNQDRNAAVDAMQYVLYAKRRSKLLL